MYLIAKDQESSESSVDSTDYETYGQQEYSPVYTTRGHRDYDEISFPDMLPTVSYTCSTVNEETGDSVPKVSCGSESYQQEESGGQLPQTGYPWLFHHTKRGKAEEIVQTDKIGSFVVIEEAIERMPFTPYTLLVLHDEHLRKIPVVKHSLKQRKVRYTLVNAPEPKLKSIQDLVCYYQRREIPGLKLRLRSPD